MNRDEAIELIEKKAKEILKVNGLDDDGVSGRIGDGCEIEGERLWVFWPTEDGETLAIYADEIMAEGRPANDEEIESLLPGYGMIQVEIFAIEPRIQE